MAVNLSPVGGVAAQFFDNSGNVLTGGKLYTYLAGTTTPATTYTTSSGNTAQPNPIVFNAAGRVPDSGEIWLSDGVLYKFSLQDQYGVQIATYDNIDGINSNFVSYTSQNEVQTATQGQTVFTLTTIQYTPATNNLAVYVNGSKQIDPTNYVETGSTTVTFVSGLNVGDIVEFSTATPVATNATSAANVSYNEGDTGSITTTVQAKLQETISVKDFGAKGDGVTDDTVAMAAAHATGKLIYYPEGHYIFTRLSSNITAGGIIGEGPTKTVLSSTDVSTNNLFNFSGIWENYNPSQTNSAFVFKDFSITSDITKAGGASINVTAPVATTQRENQLTTFYNVLFRDSYIGLHFESASFWKVIACNFINYAKAGILVENLYNADSGDSCVTNCVFETNATSSGSAGVLQYSSGGLKITGSKFLGATYGYLMAWNGASSSNLQICNNSFELMQYAAIALTRTSGTGTFKLITIVGNEIALTNTGISNDSNTWLSQVTIVGNVIETWGNYGANTVAITFNYLDNFIIANNNLDGTNGGSSNSNGISLLGPTNGQIGLNNYVGFTDSVTQSGATPAIVQLSAQSGQTDTSATGWTSYQNLYQSTTTTVTFTTPFVEVPNVWDVQLTAGDGSGTVSGIVISVTKTQMSFRAVNVYNNKASTIYWTVRGLI